MCRALVVVAALATLLWPGKLLGEVPTESSPFGGFTWTFSGGASVPMANASERFTMGGHFLISLGYRLFSRVMIQAEYLYSVHGVSADFLEGGDYTANHTIHSGLLGVLVTILPRTGPVELYIVGGTGLYGRTVEIGTVTGGPVPIVCEPSLLYCETGIAPFATGLGKRTVVGIGAQGGIGASISLGLPTRLFIETRFHYIWGTISTPEGDRAANGQYLPITLGFRFF